MAINSGQQRIIDYLKVNVKKTYPIKEIASKVGLSYKTTKNYCSLLEKGHLILRVKNGFYRGIESASPDLMEYLHSEIKDDEFRQIIIDIIENKYPLGIHYLNCQLNNVKINYKKIKWAVSNQQNGAKKYEIHNLIRFGKTIITIWEGKSKGNKPSIRVEYNGNISKSKLFLNSFNYEIWFESVETFLRSYPYIELDKGLDYFNLRQVEFNCDVDMNEGIITQNSPRNIRMKQLNEILELYRYIDSDGGQKLRFGIRQTFENQDQKNISRNFMDLFFLKDKQSKALNHTVNKVASLDNDLKDTSKKIGNLEDKITNNVKTEFNNTISHMIDENHKNNQDFIKEFKDFKENNNVVEKELTTKLDETQNFLKAEIGQNSNLLTQLSNEYSTDVTILNGKIDNQNQLVQILINNLQKANSQRLSEQKSIVDLIQTNKDDFNTIIQTIFDSIQTNQHDVVDVLNQFQSSQTQTNNSLSNLISRLIKIEEDRSKKKWYRIFSK